MPAHRVFHSILLVVLVLGVAGQGIATPPSRDAVPDINELGWKFLYWGMTQQEVREAIQAHGGTVGTPSRPVSLLLGFDPGWNPLEFTLDQQGVAALDLLALPSDVQDAELLFADDRLFGIRIAKHTPQHVQDKLFNAMRRRYPQAVSSMAGPGRYRFLHQSPQRVIVWDARPTGFNLGFYDPRVLGILRDTALLGDLQREVTPTQERAAPAPLGQETPRQPLAGDLWTEPHTGMQFTFLPGGCFTTTKRERRCVEPFWMAVFETTNAQMRIFDPNHYSGEAPGSTLDSDTMPAVGLKPSRARAFAAWLSRRTQGRVFNLPDELQWEFAARPPEDGELPTFQAGWTPWTTPDAACDHANVGNQDPGREDNAFSCLDGFATAAPVGMFQPNAWGLHDMLGNAWEWCETGADTAVDDRNTAACGGGWDSGPGQVHAGARLWLENMGANTPVGFRLVMRRVLTAGPTEPQTGGRPRTPDSRQAKPPRFALEEGW